MSAQPQPQFASALQPLWNSVGSAGIVNLDDVPNVEFQNSIVKLKGFDVIVNSKAARVSANFPIEKVQAVVRYEVTPDPGLIADEAGIALRIYCRRGHGDIQAKLIRVPIPSSPTSSVEEHMLITYNNSHTDRLPFYVDLSDPFRGSGGPVFDFVNNSYYIELTLSAQHLAAMPLTEPPEVALLHLVTQFE
jgi:hypothetical protein